jgi:hypothetical protein
MVVSLVRINTKILCVVEGQQQLAVSRQSVCVSPIVATQQLGKHVAAAKRNC